MEPAVSGGGEHVWVSVLMFSPVAISPLGTVRKAVRNLLKRNLDTVPGEHTCVPCMWSKQKENQLGHTPGSGGVGDGFQCY